MPAGPGAGEGQQASGTEPAAVGGKGEGCFRGHFCGPPRPRRAWIASHLGNIRVPLVPGIRDPRSWRGALWPTHLWAHSPPELPLRPRRVPPNRPGWQLAQGVGLGASQQMPPPGSFLFRCPQLPPSVRPLRPALSPWSPWPLGAGMSAAPWPGWQGLAPGQGAVVCEWVWGEAQGGRGAALPSP